MMNQFAWHSVTVSWLITLTNVRANKDVQMVAPVQIITVMSLF